MTTVIVDYGSGNIRSITKSCELAAQETGEAIKVTNSPDAIRAADRIILPGVGAFGDCAQGIKAISGLWEALEEAVMQKATPFLGVCVGMQLLADSGTEHGEHKGFGWIKGAVVPIVPKDPSYKIPHMGWNELEVAKSGHKVLFGIENGDHAYFVHSFHFDCVEEDVTLVRVVYGAPLVAVVAKDNIIGTQFHPEKSQHTGITLLKNFLRWKL